MDVNKELPENQSAQVTDNGSGAASDIHSRVIDQHYFRNFLDKGPDVFFSLDVIADKFIFITAACEALCGYAPGAFYNNTRLWYDVILDEDKPVADENYPLLFAGKPVDQEYRIKCGDGSVKWVQAKLEPSVDNDGKLLKVDGIVFDITARKSAEIALKQSEHRFRSLIENISDAITLVNEDFEVVYASDSMLRVTGWLPEEVKGKTFRYFVFPDDAGRVEEFFTKVIGNPGVPMEIVYRTLKKDGSYMWCDRRTTNLLHDPLVKGIISNYRDITDLQNQIEALEKANEKLSKSNLEMDKFVYSVSHDLRAPLASILGVIGLMEADPSGESVAFSLELMKGSIQKLDKFILDILDYSRNARMDISRDEVDVEMELAGIVSGLRFIVADIPGFTVTTKVEPASPTLYTDRNRLFIVLNNLVANAFRYANLNQPEPSVHIFVSVGPTQAVISVKDNGIGIPKEKHKRVFEMFYRLSSKSVGSGLGLYIVSEAVAKLKGHIDLESEPGIGTTITVTIPNMLND